jgi:hypothetical protein
MGPGGVGLREITVNARLARFPGSSLHEPHIAVTVGRRMANYPPPPPGGGYGSAQPAYDPYAHERMLGEWAKARGYTVGAHPDPNWYGSWYPFVYLFRFSRLGRELRAPLRDAGGDANAFLVEAYEGDAIKDLAGEDRRLLCFVTSPRLAYRAALRSRIGGGFVDELSRGFDSLVSNKPAVGAVLGDPTLESVFEAAAPTRDEGNAALPVPLRRLLLQLGFRGILELRPGGLACVLHDRSSFEPQNLDGTLAFLSQVHRAAIQYAHVVAPP